MRLSLIPILSESPILFHSILAPVPGDRRELPTILCTHTEREPLPSTSQLNFYLTEQV